MKCIYLTSYMYLRFHHFSDKILLYIEEFVSTMSYTNMEIILLIIWYG